MKKKKYKHFSLDERYNLKEHLVLERFKKKNGTLNYSKIGKVMNKSRNTIRLEVKRLQEEYNPEKAHYDYKKKRKKSIKKPSKLSKNKLEWLNLRFNKYHNSPVEIIKRYERKFGVKFPVCLKTLYKWIYLGVFNLLKENLPNHGKKNRTKKRPDNQDKLDNFRSIWDIKNKVSNVGWFEMDTVIGEAHQSAVLVLVEQNSKNYFAMKLKEISASKVVEKFKDIVKVNNLIGKIKGIITDRGKEFSKWREIEIFANTQVYFCDPGSPKQKPLIERINREFRHWLPKGTDFNYISQQKIDWIVNVINAKLRPCLNWISAKEIFLQNFR